MGAMAEQTLVDLRRSVVLPEGSDPVLIAAAMNPAMSSWVALRQRIPFPPGQSVLVLAATAAPGSWLSRSPNTLAPATSSRRPPAERLAALIDLGVDATVSLDGDPARSPTTSVELPAMWTSSSTISGDSPPPTPWLPSL